MSSCADPPAPGRRVAPLTGRYESRIKNTASSVGPANVAPHLHIGQERYIASKRAREIYLSHFEGIKRGKKAFAGPRERHASVQMAGETALCVNARCVRPDALHGSTSCRRGTPERFMEEQREAWATAAVSTIG